MIRINTTHIGDLPLIVRGEEKEEFLGLDPKQLPRQNGPVEYELSATMAGTDLLVTGKVRVKLDAECARCLKPMSATSMKEWKDRSWISPMKSAKICCS